MGAVLSSVKDAYFKLSMIVKTLSTLNTQFQSLLKRAVAPPGLPVPNPTTSFWQENAPFPELSNIQGDIPAEADVVIVGSGITGAAAAKTLLELGGASSPRVVVLEARQLCSGATGRNGGHIKCTPYEQFPRLRKKLGPEKARDLVRFQLSHLKALLEVGADFPAGQAREVETVDLFLHATDFEKVKADIEETKVWIPEVSFSVWENSEEMRKKFGVNEMVVGAVSYQAGAVWPFRLITSIWNDLVAKYPSLTISTDTPVENVSRDGKSTQYPYQVKCSRGTIRAKHVLHATNAFAPQLVASLRGSLTGARAHVTAQTPGQQFPSTHGERSWSVIDYPGFDYISQLPDAADDTPGHLMVGGGFFRSKEQGLDQVGIWDDSRMEALTATHLHGTIPALFRPNWGSGAAVDMAWTGILGLTGDSLPLVGRLPSSTSARETPGFTGSGEWVAAGFNGEGMVWAWLCGTAVAVMMLGLEEDELKPGLGRPGGRLSDWFVKDVLAVNEKRLRRANVANLADEV